MQTDQVFSSARARLATLEDVPTLRHIMKLAIDVNQREFLTPAEIAASHAFMGLDTQLVEDGTYFVVEIGDVIAGCGGWSRRATLFGGDHSSSLRDPRLLDCRTEAARVRAMYTHPDFARRGVGRLILEQCELAAAAEGFTRVELMATLAGEPLYTACGYKQIERTFTNVDGLAVPVVRMGKEICASFERDDST
jgi:GNAT superfamily N-acetyltransferase